MKVIVEITIPFSKEYCVTDDDGKQEGFNFSEFIAKTLTKKWFGCGPFRCDVKKIIKQGR